MFEQSVLGGELFGITAAEDAVGEAIETVDSLGIVGAADTVEDMDAGKFPGGVPDQVGSRLERSGSQ